MTEPTPTRETGMSLHDTMVEQWHAASDHAKDGTPIGGYLCNCARVISRAILLGWRPNV